jgi:hypothetical protein
MKRLVLALSVLVAAAPAAAQFQPPPMRLPSAFKAQVLAGDQRVGGGAADLWIVDWSTQGATAPVFQRVYGGRDLLTPRAVAPPFVQRTFQSSLGRFEPAPVGTPSDAAWAVDPPPSTPASGWQLAVAYGRAPDAPLLFDGLFEWYPQGIGSLRLLPREAGVILVPVLTGGGGAGTLHLIDAEDGRTGGGVTQLIEAVPGYYRDTGAEVDLILPLRLSPSARAGGVDDAFIPFAHGWFMLWHRSVPGGADLAALDLAGVSGGTPGLASDPAWLPPGVEAGGTCHGAAAVDVDGDGDPDLVWSYGFDRLPDRQGALVWQENTGDPASLETPPWRRLSGAPGGRPDLSAVQSPLTLRQLALPGPPAFAVFDQVREAILVIRGDGAQGFTVRELPAPGIVPRELLVADVVGSPAPDLVVRAQRYGATSASGEAWVYPDEGDRAPTIAFAPGPPARALRGQDLPLSVTAGDPDSPFTISWMLGDRLSPPVAAGPAFTVPGSLLCDVTAALQVTARALDDLGVYAEASASVPVVGEPTLALAGPSPDLLVLAPGGATATAEATAWPACGRTAAFTWNESGLPGLVEVQLVSGPATSARTFALPEAGYPGALAGTPSLEVTAVDELGASGSATLPLELEATGLVEVAVQVDRAALAQGELAVATARLESRLSVALPGPTARVVVDRLALAGPIEVDGVAGAPGSAPAEVTLDALPPAGSAVTLRIPVRGGGLPGALAVEVRSSGGHLLTPAAAPEGASARLPGCGCGAGGGGWPALLALVLWWRRRAT